MAKPTNRQEFKEFILRALGKPVIRVNVSDDQIDDRVDEAFQVYSERHFDSSIEKWVMYEATQADEDRGYFKVPANIQVVQQLLQTSGPMTSPPTSTETGGTGEPAPGPDPDYNLGDEYLEPGASGYPGSPPYVYGEPDFTVSASGYVGPRGSGEWNEDYNLSYEFAMMWDIYTPWAGYDALNYYMMNLNLSEMRDLVGTTVRFEHSRHTGELYIYDGRKTVKGNRFYCLVTQLLTPDDHPEVWDDRWFKQYCVELVRKQWGVNMMKHGEIQLLGGVTVSGQAFIDMAERQIEILKAQLLDELTEPVGFFMG